MLPLALIKRGVLEATKKVHYNKNPVELHINNYVDRRLRYTEARVFEGALPSNGATKGRKGTA